MENYPGKVKIPVVERTRKSIRSRGCMNFEKQNSKPAANELGELLRYWRDRRGKSQFDLALDTGGSQRHISFIESGRSVPSRQILMELAQALDIPLRDRNLLLLAAGYAPIYSE